MKYINVLFKTERYTNENIIININNMFYMNDEYYW